MLFAEFKLRLSSLRFARLLCALDDTGKDGSLPKCRCMQDMCNGPDNFMMWKRTRLKPEAPPSSCSPPPNEKATASCSEPKRQTELTMKDNDDNERPFLVLSEERRWRPQSRSSRRAMACYGVLVDVFEVEVRESHLMSSPRRRRSASRKMSRYRRQLQQEEGALIGQRSNGNTCNATEEG